MSRVLRTLKMTDFISNLKNQTIRDEEPELMLDGCQSHSNLDCSA